MLCFCFVLSNAVSKTRAASTCALNSISIYLWYIMLLLVDVLFVKSMFYQKIQIKDNKNSKGLCNTVMQMICETDLDNAGVIRYLPASGYIFKFMPLSKKKLHG